MRRFLRAALVPRGFRLVEAETRGGRRARGREPQPRAGAARPRPARPRRHRAREDPAGVHAGCPSSCSRRAGARRTRSRRSTPAPTTTSTKPFGVPELLARMRVALRHAARAAGEPPAALLEIGALRIDFARREVALAGREVRLTPIEWKLLALLAKHAGKVVTHRQILREVWGPGTGPPDAHRARAHGGAAPQARARPGPPAPPPHRARRRLPPPRRMTSRRGRSSSRHFRQRGTTVTERNVPFVTVTRGGCRRSRRSPWGSP